MGLTFRAPAHAERYTRVLVCLLALAASLSVLYTTPWGTGTGFDQGTYIGAARNLLAGHGFVIPWGAAAGQPVTHFPPLFPLVLATLGLSGTDPWDVARYFNTCLRALNVLLPAFLAARLAPGSWVAPLLTAFVLCASVHMEFVHGSAWSEPLFLSLLFASLWLLARFISTRHSGYLLASALGGAGVLLTRYAGLTLVVTGVVVLLSISWSWRHRLTAAGVFAVVCLAPLLAWVARNLLLTGLPVGNRGIALHPAPQAQLAHALFTVFDWVIPSSVLARLISPSGTVSGPGLALAALLIAALAAWLARERNASLPPEAAALRRLLLTLCVVYPACIIVSVLAFDHFTQLDSRILSPVYVSLVILLSAFVARSFRLPVAALVGALLVVFSVRFALVAQRAHSEGVMYSNTWWLTSPTMSHVTALPDNVRLFSNAPDAVYMLANRNSYEIPDAGQVAWLTDRITEGLQSASPIVLVYFDDPNIGYRNPVSARELESAFALQLIAQNHDGVVYQVIDER